MDGRRGTMLRLLFSALHFVIFGQSFVFSPAPALSWRWETFMPSEFTPARKSIFKKPLFYSSCLAAVISLYVVSILFSRWESNRNFERRQRQQLEERQHPCAAAQKCGNPVSTPSVQTDRSRTTSS
jgi:hypothetical protein